MRRDPVGFAVPMAILLMGVGFAALGVRIWLASVFRDAGPDRSADMVLLGAFGCMGGIVTLGLAAVGVYLFVDLRGVHSPSAASSAVIDQPRAMDVDPWAPMITNGPNSRQMLPRAQLLDLAGRAVRELRPAGVQPTQSNLTEAFGVGGGTASSVQSVLREWGLADVRDGVPSAWK